MLRKTSLYTALTVAVMSTLLLMSYVILQYVPQSGNEALLIRAPRLTTDVWGVFDPATGALRYGSKVDEVHEIASITKLFTAYAVMATGSDGVTTTITWSDVNTEGRAGKLAYGEVYSLRELLFPLLIESSNDAGAAIERALGQKFGESVTAFIKEKELTSTTIRESTGLSPQNVSAVRDLARMYVRLRQDHPFITDVTQLRMYLNGRTGLINNDPLRSLTSFTGGKYGYTPSAGRTFVGTVALPDRKGELGIVILGSTELLKDVTELIDSFE
jgi:serine-type D-Ala-D-Ala carboxypeptidase (penicillin-binding protein 5/6)